jgi:hypothetical protein
LPVGGKAVQRGKTNETAGLIGRFSIVFCVMWQNIAKSFQTELNDLSKVLSFAPAWVIWAALLVGVFVVACLVHAGLLAFLHRLFRSGRPYLNRVLDATKNPIRLALLLLALAIALPTAPLGPEGKFIFVRCLVLGTICLIGWIASRCCISAPISICAISASTLPTI